MKEGMRIVEKVCRSDGLWCWLCTDGQGGWVTYIGTLENNREKLKMYQNEFPDFKIALKQPGVADEMWSFLEKLISTPSG